MLMLRDESSPKLDRFWEDERDGLFYVSHASILVRLSGKVLLFDPVLATPPHLGSWLFFPKMILDRRLLKVDAVFISHQHRDHCDVDFLKQLPKSTPIYILEGRSQFKEIFLQSGLSVTELPANQVQRLTENIDFLGVDHDYNKIDSSLTISNGNLTVYHGNDCFLSNEKLTIVNKTFQCIDVACVPFAYVHWYPFLIDDVPEDWKNEEAKRLINKYLNYGLEQVRTLSPKIAIPFGANMFYFDEIESDHNKAVLTPFDFKYFSMQAKFELEKSIVPLFAGDYIIKNSQSEHPEIFQSPFTPEELKSSLRQFIIEMRIQGTGVDLDWLQQVPNTTHTELGFINLRLAQFQGEPINHNVYISNSEHYDGLIEINLNTFEATRRTKIDENTPFHHFKLTDLAFRAYISQEFTLNEIVASSRFRLSRKPNEYNLALLNIVNNVL